VPAMLLIDARMIAGIRRRRSNRLARKMMRRNR